VVIGAAHGIDPVLLEHQFNMTVAVGATGTALSPVRVR